MISSVNSSYRELSEVFTFVRVLPGRLASPAQLVVEPHEQVPDGLGTRDDVERRRQRSALVKVTHPQLGAGELPLDVGVVLQDRKKKLDVAKCSLQSFISFDALLCHHSTISCDL